MKILKTIYMDYQAATPVDARVLEAMKPYFSEIFANPSSAHSSGKKAAAAVEKARAEIAECIGAQASEIIFTSGATESNNLALKGVAHAYKEKGRHIITLATEHKSVLDPCRRLETEGFRVTYLAVKKDGLVDLNKLREAITPQTILISIMTAHNEIGVLQPIQEIGRIARKSGVLFHTDAAQAFGKIPFSVKDVDLVSMTAHKIYGPKGIGLLYVRKSGAPVRLIPLTDGGGHEVGMRSGTLNVPGIVGFAKAAQICQKELSRESRRLRVLRDYLLKALLKLKGVSLNGSFEHRLPHNLNVSFDSVDAKELLGYLNEKGVMISSGSACLSTSPESSYVLKALGVAETLRKSSIRFGLGRFSKKSDVDKVIFEIQDYMV